MDLKARPLIISVVVAVILTGITQVIFISLTNIGTITSGQVQPSSISPVATAISCFCLPIIVLGVGLLYAFLHNREAALTAAAALLGGGVTGLAAGTLSALLGACATVVAIPLILGQQPNVLLASPAAVLVGAVVGTCGTGIYQAIVAGIGALIGYAIWGRKPRPAAAAA